MEEKKQIKMSYGDKWYDEDGVRWFKEEPMSSGARAWVSVGRTVVLPIAILMLLVIGYASHGCREKSKEQHIEDMTNGQLQYELEKRSLLEKIHGKKEKK